jgi:hypothetical protein
MSVPAGDGLILKGTLTYPARSAGGSFPLAVLAHQYPATRDSYSPLVADLLDSGIATLAFDERAHGASIVSPTGPLVVDSPEAPGLEAFGKAFVSESAPSSSGLPHRASWPLPARIRSTVVQTSPPGAGDCPT